MVHKNNKKKVFNILHILEKKYITIPILILITFLVYYPTLNYEYVYCDDTDIVIRDYERIKELSRIPDEFLSGYMNTNYYRPLQNLSYIINNALLGNTAFSYKFLNLILHLIFIIFLNFFLLNLGINIMTSFCLSLIFSIHPLFVNAVVWIPGRNDIIYALFGIISFLIFIKYQKQAKLHLLIIHSLFLFLSIMSKETALILPILMLLYVYFINEEKIISKKNLKSILIWISIVLIWLLFRSHSTLGQSKYTTGLDIIIYNLPSIVEYLGKFILPIKLSPLATYTSFNTIIGLITFCSLIIFIIRTRKANFKYNLYSLLFYLLLIAPGLFIAFTNYQEWNDYLECRAYLPIVGILFMLGKAIDKYINHNSRKILLIIMTVVVSGLIFLNISYSSNYRNAIKFYEYAIKQDKNRAMFHFILARIYQKERQFEKAEQYLKQSVNLNPASARFNHNLGVHLLNSQKPDSAIRYLKVALELDSTNSKTYDALANAFFFARNFDSALYYWELIIQKWSDNFEVMLNLVKLLITHNNFEQAVKYANILKINNYKTYELAEIFNLFGINILNKNEKLALASFHKAIEIEPNYTKSYENLFRYYFEYKKDKDKARIYAIELMSRNVKIPYQMRMQLGLIDE